MKALSGDFLPLSDDLLAVSGDLLRVSGNFLRVIGERLLMRRASGKLSLFGGLDHGRGGVGCRMRFRGGGRIAGER